MRSLQDSAVEAMVETLFLPVVLVCLARLLVLRIVCLLIGHRCEVPWKCERCRHFVGGDDIIARRNRR